MSSEHFIVLDLDRCLCDTQKLSDALIRSLALLGFDIKKLTSAQQRTEAQNQSFDTLSFVKREVGDHKWEPFWQELSTNFYNSCKNEDLFMPGAKELLNHLSEEEIAHGILTHGGEAWQKAKIKALGLNIPHVITDDPHKGFIIEKWQDEGGFTVPSKLSPKRQTFKKVTLIDDRERSFVGLPISASGYLVKANAREIAGQPHINVAQDLITILKIFQKRA